MTPLIPASIDQILSSATVGGILTAEALALLFVSQMLYWRRASVAPGVRRLAVSLAVLYCVFVVVFISARFAIID